MSPEEIQALVESSIGNAISGLREEFTKANQGLAASLTKEVKKVLSTQVSQPAETEQEDSSKLTLKSLQQQLADLQSQLAQKDKEAFSAKKSQAISQVIANSQALNPSALMKLFSLEYGDSIKEENGAWFVDKGDNVLPLQDALNTYLNSDEGKFYLPPSGVNGSGATETKPVPVNTNQPLKAEDALFAAFSNY
jgi:hypothetical protein